MAYRIVVSFALVLASATSAPAAWSVIALDRSSGTVVVSSATCVPQARLGDSFNDGQYAMYISITDKDIKPTENANPAKTLRRR